MFNYKKIRSEKLFELFGDVPVGVYTCGNSAIQLRAAGFTDVLDIGADGLYQPNEWHYSHAVRQIFNHRVDLTSGHLPIDLCLTLGIAYSNALDKIPNVIPSGSGETVLSLSLANPDNRFVAAFDNAYPHTTMNKENKITVLLSIMKNITVDIK